MYPAALALLALCVESRFHLLLTLVAGARGSLFLEKLLDVCSLGFSSLLVGVTIVVALRDRFVFRALSAAGRLAVLVSYFREAITVVGLCGVAALVLVGTEPSSIRPWLCAGLFAISVWSLFAAVRVIGLLLMLLAVDSE